MHTTKRALLSLIILLGLIALIPWAVYMTGLLRVEGRPTPADPAAYDRASLVSAWEDCRESTPMSVERLDPWTIAIQLLLEAPSSTKPGQRAAWRIAASHNAAHPVGNMLWWHTSGTALTLWITRHWSADQISATLIRDGSCRTTTKQRHPNGQIGN